jgi:hypothetical protein
MLAPTRPSLRFDSPRPHATAQRIRTPPPIAASARLHATATHMFVAACPHARLHVGTTCRRRSPARCWATRAGLLHTGCSRHSVLSHLRRSPPLRPVPATAGLLLWAIDADHCHQVWPLYGPSIIGEQPSWPLSHLQQPAPPLSHLPSTSPWVRLCWPSIFSVL